MSKKHSRAIEVDGVSYRFAVFQNSGFTDVTVQSVEGNGRKLSVQVAWLNEGADPPSVTPQQVADAIRFGLGAGWRPDESGAPFTCRLADGVFAVR